ncbi:MAG: hypothetical protein LBQ69_04480 [Treponema sp.]|nr:hypothetical protein [Treponema sp.]
MASDNGFLLPTSIEHHRAIRKKRGDRDWGLGAGDWGLGARGWGLGSGDWGLGTRD